MAATAGEQVKPDDAYFRCQIDRTDGDHIKVVSDGQIVHIVAQSPTIGVSAFLQRGVGDGEGDVVSIFTAGGTAHDNWDRAHQIGTVRLRAGKPIFTPT